jgi:hypothetical protein
MALTTSFSSSAGLVTASDDLLSGGGGLEQPSIHSAGKKAHAIIALNMQVAPFRCIFGVIFGFGLDATPDAMPS